MFSEKDIQFSKKKKIMPFVTVRNCILSLPHRKMVGRKPCLRQDFRRRYISTLQFIGFFLSLNLTTVVYISLLTIGQYSYVDMKLTKYVLISNKNCVK